jgi:hypothetical protein
MTPLRIALLVLAVGAAIVVVYALFVDNSPTKLPLLVSGLAVVAVALAILGFGLAGSAVRLGESGRAGRALGSAFVGGLFVIAACGALAAAIVLGILAMGVA